VILDLNADLAEGLAAEAEVLPLVTSANLACGFHAGDPLAMRRAVALARTHGVVVGAHPGYPDRAGFGRRDLGASAEEIAADVLYQIGALAALCRAEGVALRYVKPHGALYNRAATDPVAAVAIAEAVRLADPALVLLGLAGSAMLHAAAGGGLRTAAEAFADRAYLSDGTLAPRARSGAVLTDDEAVVRQALGIVRDGCVTTLDGGTHALRADSLCVHGDNPRAPALLRLLRERLAAEGVTIAPFAR
jgi:UPF0271 protein